MSLETIDIEKLFHIFDRSATMLSTELNISYLEALAETGENIFEGTVLQQLDPSKESQLLKEYKGFDISEIAKETIRKAFQLAILKGMKEAIQPNHEMTPDAVCLFIHYLVEKVYSKKKSLRLLDLAYGTGNLVNTILNNTTMDIKAYGVEIDEILIHLAYVAANLQRNEIELFRQDALQPIFVQDVDIVVSDFPVGYYPNDAVAKEYELHADDGEHSFSHYLYIEKSLRHLNEGGYLIALIPNFMFEGEKAKQLHEYIKKHAVIIGLLQLPLSMFKHNQYGKSIFILRKKGEGVHPPKQALLVDLPSFSKKDAMRNIVQQIDHWFQENIAEK